VITLFLKKYMQYLASRFLQSCSSSSSDSVSCRKRFSCSRNANIASRSWDLRSSRSVLLQKVTYERHAFVHADSSVWFCFFPR